MHSTAALAPETASVSWCTPRLTPDQVAFYHREGYLLPQVPVLPEREFAALSALFERLLADWTAQGGRPEAMDVPHFYYPELLTYVLHDSVLDLVEPILGPDIALFSTHFVCKPPFDGKRVPWHEDSAYWRKVLDPMDVVTVWLAIDDSTLENGCMSIIPRSHANGYSAYDPLPAGQQVFDSEIRRGEFDEGAAVPCILQRNQASLHHAKMIHGSPANPSAKRRCGYTMRFISTRTRYRSDGGHAHHALHQCYLARGRDHAGNAYGDRTKPNQRWIDHFGVFCPKGH